MARQPIFHELQQLPTDERARAMERIIPLELVQEVLDQTGHSGRATWFAGWSSCP